MSHQSQLTKCNPRQPALSYLRIEPVQLLLSTAGKASVFGYMKEKCKRSLQRNSNLKSSLHSSKNSGHSANNHVLTIEDSSDSNPDEHQDSSDDANHQTEDADMLIHMAKSGNMNKEFTAAEFLSQKKSKDKNEGKVTVWRIQFCPLHQQGSSPRSRCQWWYRWIKLSCYLSY